LFHCCCCMHAMCQRTTLHWTPHVFQFELWNAHNESKNGRSNRSSFHWLPYMSNCNSHQCDKETVCEDWPLPQNEWEPQVTKSTIHWPNGCHGTSAHCVIPSGPHLYEIWLKNVAFFGSVVTGHSHGSWVESSMRNAKPWVLQWHKHSIDSGQHTLSFYHH